VESPKRVENLRPAGLATESATRGNEGHANILLAFLIIDPATVQTVPSAIRIMRPKCRTISYRIPLIPFAVSFLVNRERNDAVQRVDDVKQKSIS